MWPTSVLMALDLVRFIGQFGVAVMLDLDVVCGVGGWEVKRTGASSINNTLYKPSLRQLLTLT